MSQLLPVVGCKATSALYQEPVVKRADGKLQSHAGISSFAEKPQHTDAVT